MESTITGTVGEVAGRTVNTRTGPAPIFDVTIGSQKVSTFKAPVAEEAKALQGSIVEATVDVTEKNGYTNYTLLSLKLTNAVGTPAASSTIPVAAPRNDDDTAARIARSVAFEHLPQYASVGAEDEIFSTLDKFAKWIYNGSKPGQELVAVAAEPVESNDGIPW